MPVTVSIVEDHQPTRECLAKLLQGESDVQHIGSYATAEEALRDIPLAPPDVVLVDIQLPGMTGVDCVARLKSQLPELEVLMLTTYEQSDLIFRSLCAGASGYLLKNTPFADVLKAIEQVRSGGVPMSMPIARKVIEHFRQKPKPDSDMEPLTAREHEILALLAGGKPDREIGCLLDISFCTVRNHLKNIYQKLHEGRKGS